MQGCPLKCQQRLPVRWSIQILLYWEQKVRERLSEGSKLVPWANQKQWLERVGKGPFVSRKIWETPSNLIKLSRVSLVKS